MARCGLRKSRFSTQGIIEPYVDLMEVTAAAATASMARPGVGLAALIARTPPQRARAKKVSVCLCTGLALVWRNNRPGILL